MTTIDPTDPSPVPMTTVPKDAAGSNRITGEYAWPTEGRPQDEVAIIRVRDVFVFVTFGENDDVPLVMIDTTGDPDASTVRVTLNDSDLFPVREDGPRTGVIKSSDINASNGFSLSATDHHLDRLGRERQQRGRDVRTAAHEALARIPEWEHYTGPLDEETTCNECGARAGRRPGQDVIRCVNDPDHAVDMPAGS